MKPVVMLKIPILLGAFGAALMFSPACKAQEISTEQFADRNTVPFESVNNPFAPNAEQPKPIAAKSSASVHANKKAEPLQTAQLTPIHEVAKQAGQGAAVVADKRKGKKQ